MHHICVVLSIGHAIELLFWPNCFVILPIKQLYSMCPHIAISPLLNNAQRIIMRYQGAIIMLYQHR